MYTQCPKCETTFRLSAENLRQANGKVRCGDCDAVFNALEYLAEDVAAGAETADAESHSDGWTSSATNPSGDTEPDLDTYEASAYADDSASALDDEFEDEHGTILYIGEDTDDTDSPDEVQPAETDLTADDAVESEFNDEVWDNIPGVGDNPAKHDEDEDVTNTIAPHDQGPDGDESGVSMEASTEAEPEDLEFNVPADKWSNFFGPLPEGQVTEVWKPPLLVEDEAVEEQDGDSSADSPESGEQHDAEPDSLLNPDRFIPQWKDGQRTRGAGRLITLGVALLMVVLIAQLIHYNRDSLAAHPTYGAQLRALYSNLGDELYPDWAIDDYEIRGSEAIAGESGTDVLDIRTQIANVGLHPVGLPRLRVVLRDRWSNPVAAQDFGARDYAVDPWPTDRLLQPGKVVDAHVSIRDPGSGAQGFELELCLPRRATGLECTDQPFK